MPLQGLCRILVSFVCTSVFSDNKYRFMIRRCLFFIMLCLRHVSGLACSAKPEPKLGPESSPSSQARMRCQPCAMTTAPLQTSEIVAMKQMPGAGMPIE